VIQQQLSGVRMRNMTQLFGSTNDLSPLAAQYRAIFHKIRAGG
jgi:hypothetical protein